MGHSQTCSSYQYQRSFAVSLKQEPLNMSEIHGEITVQTLRTGLPLGI